MSKIAKDIKNQPKLKKALATYIAENSEILDPIALLLEGHRGFLAMSEKELTKKFDEMYDGFNDQLKEAKTKLIETPRSWFYVVAEKELTQKIKEADELYDSLFEQLFL